MAPRDQAVVVEKFLASLADLRRTETIRTCLHDDAVVQDVIKAPQPAIEAIRGRWPGATRIVACVGNLAVRGQAVHVEHRDEVTMADGSIATIECTGTYVVDDGRLKRARVYYDRATFHRRLGEGRGAPAEDEGADLVAPHGADLVGHPGPGREPDGHAALAARAFFRDWAEPDPEDMARWWWPDGVFDNVPDGSGPPRRGAAEIRELWAQWTDRVFSGVDIDIVSMAAAGDLVFVERLDHVRFRDGRVRTLPCHAVVEFRDARITAVRDHFDFGWFARAVRV
ncbi:limonene-1,2-epoxide hydrolase family protein [Amycolatopsis sp. YIM 10]|uniref:nuclear transport factor 2 family protein n=1 Tax=Amycolatopsis sp. YIM 10 TaxID=2653857 RepID=UPI00188316F0|nr:limonene-1,2-epoxide hydrolase family protein [Amycolatopsis sp. YIM 10]